MNPTKQRYAQALLALAAIGGMTAATAMEMPPRQPGLWKQTEYEGQQTGKPESVVYQCVDEASDQKFRAMAKKMAGSCSEDKLTRRGNRMVGQSVCQIMGSKVTTDYVISGNMKTEFRVESRSKHEPPLLGNAGSESVIVAEWQGACKPGQKPGDMIFEEDGKQGTVNMESLGNMPDMTKALEQLQSSEGLGKLLEQAQKAQSQAAEAGVNMQDVGKMMEQLQQMQKQFQR